MIARHGKANTFPCSCLSLPVPCVVKLFNQESACPSPTASSPSSVPAVRRRPGWPPRPSRTRFFFPKGLGASYRDRIRYDRPTILAECLRAWRTDPVARRIVKIYTQFMVGNGIVVKSNQRATHQFVRRWWQDEQNRLDEQIPEWMDELTRTGDLFLLFSVDPVSGMSYVRALPSDSIQDIQTSENDVRQETCYLPQDMNLPPYPAFDGSLSQAQFVLHYAVNRPVGCKFGEPDLAPLLPWVGRYATWLEDRARLNKFRQAFIFMVKGDFADAAAKAARQNELNSNPPPSGSVLVTDTKEEWSVLAPKLASQEAAEDELSIKKVIALGAGLPLHYLAEPESSTRTTAEAAGAPTFRGMEQAQASFIRMLTRAVRIAVRIRRMYAPGEHLNPDSVEVVGPAITEQDNAALAQAVAQAYPALADLFDRQGIDEAELLRLVYRMAGETFRGDAKAPKMVRKEVGRKE